MKIASSLKSLRKRDLNSKIVKRRGKIYVINKKILDTKLVKVNYMSEQEHKNTWNGFTKLVLFGTIAVVSLLIILAVTLL